MFTTKFFFAILCFAWCGVSAQLSVDVTVSPPIGVIGNNQLNVSCIRDEVLNDMVVIEMARVDNGTEVLLIYYSLAAGNDGFWTAESGDLPSRATFDVKPTPKPYLDLTFNEVRCDDEGKYVCRMIGGNVQTGIRIYEGDAMVELQCSATTASSPTTTGTSATPGEPCTHPPDESFDAGCRAYTRCVDGIYTLFDCLDGLVFNKDTGACDLPENVPKPCGVWMDCIPLADGRYPDYDYNCTYFYTCDKGVFLGHNPCSDDLVFNPEIQVCDWIYNVVPPCGTKGTRIAKEADFD